MEVIRNFFAQVDIWQVLSSFIFLIAIIDPFGNIPITIAMEKRGISCSWANGSSSSSACRLSISPLPADLSSSLWRWR